MDLKRELTLLDVFCIASGAMISSGLFILPGLAFAQAGPAMVISYFFAALLALTGMLSQAELASAMPKAGGTYFYVTRAMGPARYCRWSSYLVFLMYENIFCACRYVCFCRLGR